MNKIIGFLFAYYTEILGGHSILLRGQEEVGTVAISCLQTKKELGARKSKFDWLDFINKEPKFWGFVNSEFIPEHD